MALTADCTLFTQIATDEIAHVDFLRSVLGNASAPQPEINIGSAFSAAANAAFGMTLPVNFSAYGSDALFLLSAFIFEDVGVTAYKVWTCLQMLYAATVGLQEKAGGPEPAQ